MTIAGRGRGHPQYRFDMAKPGLDLSGGFIAGSFTSAYDRSWREHSPEHGVGEALPREAN